MIITRGLTSQLQQLKKSVLLLGPRQTGKSTLIRGLNPDLSINLAQESTFLDFARNPRELEERLAGQQAKTVFIDEIQRLPGLLNTIQFLLDEKKPPIKFFLTGSSARKLKRGGANLLPGRINAYHLGSVTSSELDYQLDTKEALSTGTLPGILSEDAVQEKKTTLQTYAATYLKEEIQSESLTRQLEGFSRFLFVAAAEAGKFLDISKLAAQAQIPRQSAVRYFEILEDTLIARRADAFSKSDRKRLIQHPRFFFFDVGVLNAVRENFVVSGDRIGNLFEHLLFNQMMDSAAAQGKNIRLSSYRTEHGAEVDFIVEYEGDIFAVEAKASTHIAGSDLRGLKNFADYYGKKHEAFIVYLGSTSKKLGAIHLLPWQSFLKKIGL